MAHELPGLFINSLGIDEDFADFLVEIVADGANDQTAFLINQVCAALLLGGGFDRSPQLHQVTQVPVQFLDRASDSRGAGNDAHAVGYFELVDRVPQFVAFFAFDASGNAAAARIVRHEDDIAAGEADERGQGRAFGTALVLVDLDDKLLAFAQGFPDGDPGRIGVGILEKRAADFLERKESMALVAVIYEGGLEAGFNAGDDTLVDIAFALLFSCCFDIEVDELLAIDDRDTQFFRLGRIKQHTLHFCSPALTFHGEDKPCGAVYGASAYWLSVVRLFMDWKRTIAPRALGLSIFFVLHRAGLWNPLECCERAMHRLTSLLFRVSELNPSRRRRIGGNIELRRCAAGLDHSICTRCHSLE